MYFQERGKTKWPFLFGKKISSERQNRFLHFGQNSSYCTHLHNTFHDMSPKTCVHLSSILFPIWNAHHCATNAVSVRIFKSVSKFSRHAIFSVRCNYAYLRYYPHQSQDALLAVGFIVRSTNINSSLKKTETRCQIVCGIWSHLTTGLQLCYRLKRLQLSVLPLR